MHGSQQLENKIKVVIWKPDYYWGWRNLHDGEFIDNFNKYWYKMLDDHQLGRQTLHAARVSNLIQLLDMDKVREVAVKVFPRRFKTTWPCLKDTKGNSQVGKFLKRLHMRLDEEIELAPPENVKDDFVSIGEWGDKCHELCFVHDLPTQTEKEA